MAKAVQPQKIRFSQAIQTPLYKNLVNNTLGDPVRAGRFIANITSAVAVNAELQKCDPGTILAGALLGESLFLQPSPQLGQFYLVPFKSKAKYDREGQMIEPEKFKAQFMLGYKGYIQLALRTGQYKRLNVLEVKNGELSGWDPFEERFHEMHFIEDFEKRMSMPTIGYIAHFEYINGFQGRSRWQVWSDWITISAIAVSNATDKSHFDEREQQYMTIVKKYTKQEVDTFADMFSLLVMALEDDPEQDFLGELYMCLGLGSDHAGQFFTPYHLCEFMSAVTTPAEEFQQKIGDRGWVAVCDPTCGAGALLVAFANECRKKGINYQTDVLFVAQDIDYIVGMMCYLQMSLLGMPGYVVIGDTLANPSVSYDKRGLLPVDKGNVWYTPLLRIPVWQYRIFMAQMELVTQPIKEECAADAPKSEPQKALEATKKSKQPKDTEKPKTAKIPPKEPEQEPMFSEGKGGQLSFF